MKSLILLCVVATAMANPFWSGWLDTRGGECPRMVDVQTKQSASRCTADILGNPLDYTCDIANEETFKCCEYEGIRICVPPVEVVTEAPSMLGNIQPKDNITQAIEKTRDFIAKVGKYPPPPSKYLTPVTPDTIRWCVSDPCQKTKCKRMATEFTYSPNMVPRKEWACVKATSQEQCMFWIEQGWADIMTTRQGEVFIANTTFNLKPIAYESTTTDDFTQVQSHKYYQNITFALKSARLQHPNTWAELRDKTTCHAGIDMPASFNAPVCRLIREKVIPVTGDHVESFADFVQESCVPGILNKTYNKNETYPKSLVSLCQDQQKEYTGIMGALMCLDSGKGQVTFVDHKVIKKLIADENERDNFMVVCKGESRALDEDALDDVDCHVGHTPRPTIFISKNNTRTKENEIKDLLRKALEFYGNTDPLTRFNIFDSSVYECEPCRWSGKPLNKNLLFLEESDTMEIIDESKVFAPHVYEAYSTCSILVPKPRAKMCVTNITQYNACLHFKDVAEKLDQVKQVAWGCVLANSSMECMQAVHNNTADLFMADPMETFIAGKEFMLDPMMSVHKNTSVTYNHTFTRTLAIIKTTSLGQFEELISAPEGQPKYIKDLWKLKICSAGLKNFSAFHNPIGWLLANGTIPRIGSVFESVNRFFQATCVPGVEPETWQWDSDLLLGHELNWGFPTLNMYNFTGQNWLTWNTPATWNMYSYNRKVSSGFNLQQLMELKKFNFTTPLVRDDPNSGYNFEMLDDLMGVEGLSDLMKELKENVGNSDRQRIFKDRLTNAFPNFQGVTPNPLTDKIDFINQMRQARQTRIQNLDLPIAEQIRDYFKVPFMTGVMSKLLELRSDKIQTLEEIIAHIKSIPTLTDFKEQEITTVLKHPAIMSYVQTYFPRLAQTYVEPFDNVELRQREFNRYTNPLWLSPDVKTFLEVVKKHMTEIKATCKSNLPLNFEGYEGSLRCLKSGVADMAFIDEQTLRDKDLMAKVGYTYNDLRLLCPNGQVVEIDPELEMTKVCNFGEVMNPALMVAYNKSGSWRWNVTKAMMIAHQSPAVLTLFGKDTMMGEEFNRLFPISLLNQTYQIYLGPMGLRSMEAIVKPSSYDWFKDKAGICYGDTFTNMIAERNGTCRAVVKDVTCVGQPRMKKISVGRFEDKKYKMVKMCSRPSKFVRQMAEFMCDNGHGYVRPVMTAIACECMPCVDLIEINATFPQDPMWKNENNKLMLTGENDIFHNITIWGNSSFWYNHTLNRNFELGNHTIMTEMVREVVVENPVPGVLSQIDSQVDPNDPILLDTPAIQKSCESVWSGLQWRKEWFTEPYNVTGTCVMPVPGVAAKSRLARLRETMLRQSRREQ